MVFFTDMCTWQEAAYMALQWRAKTTVTAFYIGDGRLRHNTKYDFHLFEPTTTLCPAWTRTLRAPWCMPPSADSSLDPAEMRKVAHALIDAGRPFLWVVGVVQVACRVPRRW
jgi:pathogen-inducible salicylic acid glucosyltransferase